MPDFCLKNDISLEKMAFITIGNLINNIYLIIFTMMGDTMM